MTNLYYGTVKQLLERVASVMVDREATEHLIDLVDDGLQALELGPSPLGHHGRRHGSPVAP